MHQHNSPVKPQAVDRHHLLKSGEMFVVWDPDVPNSLTKREMRLYENARNEAFQKLAERAGLDVLVVSL